MAVSKRDHTPARPHRWVPALSIAALVLLAQTPSIADSPCLEWLDGSSAAVPQDETHDALLRALAAYSAHDITTAQWWAGRAKDLLDRAPRPDPRDRKWILGNAGQLLGALEFYGVYAYGRHPDLDAEFDATVARLRRVEFVNRHRCLDSTHDDADVSTDAFTHLATRIADLAIDYDPFTLQITRIGDVAINYNAFTRVPERIGGIEFHYDPFSGQPTRIADVDLH